MQHYIKYFNPKKAHPRVIPRIFSHASKSVKGFDVRTPEKNCETKKLSASGVFAPRTTRSRDRPYVFNFRFRLMVIGLLQTSPRPYEIYF